ncbi:hypothetical protein AB0A60_32525 [Streptomyces sp. NPDC046275]|uniref:hypothetical protein n=1 Tax=Streptomyces sp. NPDC046275 TaxID=3157201 RepID=UPI0033E9897D
MSELTIIECTSPAELFRQYPGQHEPQPAYIELGLKSSTLLADYNSEVGGARPADVHYGFDRHYPIPLLTAKAANQAMERIRPLAERILADWEEIWDGNNLVARLGDDALAAEEEIEDILGDGSEDGWGSASLIAVWDLDGATNGYESTDHGITADTTDERLAEIADEIRTGLTESSGNGDDAVVVVDGLDEYLTNLRDNAPNDEDDEDA